jgi:5,10-methylenetetrahydromethanopterin reductase
MEYGVAFASELDSWKWTKRAEELGFSSAWFYDTQLLNPDVFICMTLAAANTERIRLGTGVLVPTNRIEPVTANAFVSLNKLAPGRIDFGVGTGFTARRTMGLNAIPLVQTRRYIERVQSLIRGETIEWDFEGKNRKIRFLNPDLGLINIEDEIPLWVSAFGPKGQKMTAELNAGWLNFGAGDGAVQGISDMQLAWRKADRDSQRLNSVLFTMGSVMTGDSAVDDLKVMAEAGPYTAVICHGAADTAGMFDSLKPEGPLAELLESYLEIHQAYEPADAKYLQNHRGHLMFVRPEETHLNPDIVRATSMSGTRNELVDEVGRLKDAGYSQLTIQLVHGHEEALEEWAEVFQMSGL